MHNTIKNNKLKTLNILLICWIACIWIQSMIPAYASSEESQFIGQLVEPVLEVFIGKGAVTDFIVRKLAHFTEYAILGVLMCANLLARFHSHEAHSDKASDRAAIKLYHWSYVLLLILAVAVIDESIQLLTPGRSSQVTDVLIDTSGGFTGIVLLRVMTCIRTAVAELKSKPA